MNYELSILNIDTRPNVESRNIEKNLTFTPHSQNGLMV